ncbi:MAG: hypothetical protein ACE5GA_06300 [Candidatus Zixiibacteriota bacterium]
MRKQILLVENDEQTRTAIEAVLRQAGYEVVSVDSASRAEGILSVSTFDLSLLGDGIQDESGLYAVNWLQSQDHAESPFLMLCPQDIMIPEIPEELVIRCPIEPETLLARIAEVTGEQTIEAQSQRQSAVQPPAQTQSGSGEPEALFGEGGVHEDFFDQALGLDQLEVNESETMDASDTTQTGPKAPSESLVGYEADVTSVSSTQHAVTDTGEISLDSVRKKIDEEAAGAPPPQEIELHTDHNLRPPPPEQTEDAPSEKHDYNWFISEMRGGEGPAKAPAAQPKKASRAKGKGAAKKSPAEFAKMVKKDIASKGKKKAPVAQRPPAATDNLFDWSDAPSEEDVAAVFTQQMADAIATRVADSLLKQLNSDKFARLIQLEIKKYLKSHT